VDEIASLTDWHRAKTLAGTTRGRASTRSAESFIAVARHLAAAPAPHRKTPPVRPSRRVSPTATVNPKRSSTPPAPSPALELPELRVDAAPVMTVRLRGGAMRGICEELERSDGLLDRIETGGNLIGRRVGGVLELVAATGPGSDGQPRRFVDAVRVSMGEGHEAGEWIAEYYQDALITFVGGWHTHPVPVREPSTTDRESALVGLDALNARLGWKAPSQWVDLILMSDTRDGWGAPRIAGWATRRIGTFQSVTEPVSVELA